jgi:DNA-binding NarL/FixJ family response regulator
MSRHLPALTQREHETIQLLMQGLANRQIAHTLGIAEHTVEKHLSNIYRKLNVTNRVNAVFAYFEVARQASNDHTGFPS